MRERFRSFDSKISFFAFADIITAVSGMLIFITLLLATDLGRPTDNQSSAANSELERHLKDTLAQQANADVENRTLQQLLATANTAPAPDKLEADISRLRTELADEKSKHAGMAEQLAASESTLREQDKLLGITDIREQIQQDSAELKTLADKDASVREETAALGRQIAGVQSKIVKLRQREGQLWLIPDRAGTTKEPILVIVSGKEMTIERFNHPEQTQQFSKSRAQAEFENYLKHAKASEQYVVFLIRPSGIGMFKDLVETAKDDGFEVGFDALEEDREIHFTAPPPIDDEAVPEKRMAGASAGSAVPPTERRGASAATNPPPEPSPSTVIASATNPAPAAPAAAPPPKPPKPKSWWQRLLEWIGIG
jgi:K+/H+ antiporter YhaU regulatory subunit KhtT